MKFTHLDTFGYQIIHGVLSEDEIELGEQLFHRWHSTNQIADSPHGVIKHYKSGHSSFAWFIRTRPGVLSVFEDLYNTNDLVVSFDGQCYFPPGQQKRNNWWIHTDQAPAKEGRRCVQAFVSLTTNTDCGLAIIEKTHLQHHHYFREKGIEHNRDWQKVSEEDFDKTDMKLVGPLNKGDMVIWDSRLFHQNLYSPSGEERLVQYVCYLPRSGLSHSQAAKRARYYLESRTSSHWPYPIRVNSLQPQVFGDKTKLIDYDRLFDTDEDLKEVLSEFINKLI